MVAMAKEIVSHYNMVQFNGKTVRVLPFYKILSSTLKSFLGNSQPSSSIILLPLDFVYYVKHMHTQTQCTHKNKHNTYVHKNTNTLAHLHT